MVGLLVADVAAAVDIGVVPAQTGALIVVAMVGLQAKIGVVDLPVSSGPQRTDWHSIARMAPWTAGPEVTVVPAAASGPTVMATVMVAVALALVLMPTVMDSVVVIAAIAAMTTPSVLPPGVDSSMGVLMLIGSTLYLLK